MAALNPLQRIFFRSKYGALEEDMDDIHLYLALGALSKSFTYPVIDIDLTVRNFVEKATVYRPVHSIGEEAALMFKKDFIQNYVKTERKWPNIRIITHANMPANMIESIREGGWYEGDDYWEPSLFQHIEILKTLEFNWHPDATDLLSDKSIALPLDSWQGEYNTVYHKLRYGWFPPPPRDRQKG